MSRGISRGYLNFTSADQFRLNLLKKRFGKNIVNNELSHIINTSNFNLQTGFILSKSSFFEHLSSSVVNQLYQVDDDLYDMIMNEFADSNRRLIENHGILVDRFGYKVD